MLFFTFLTLSFKKAFLTLIFDTEHYTRIKSFPLSIPLFFSPENSFGRALNFASII